MRSPSKQALIRLCGGTVAAALAAAYLRTLAPGVTWANRGADSGDLIAAAATLGVAHPSGYPTYLLLARAFQAIPLGDLAFRTTLLSAAAAILAALLVGRLVLLLCGAAEWHTIAAACVAMLALGLAPLFWSQAIIAEVYSLNSLCFAALLSFMLDNRQRDTGAYQRAPMQGLIAGLALGNHLTVGLAVAVWLVTNLKHASRARLVLWRALWLGCGLLVYLYLPLRAAAHPPINWGAPHDWAGFWWVVSGQAYQGLAFGVPASLLGGRIAAWAALLLQQFGPLGLTLGCVGLLYGAPRARGFVWISAGLALAISVFALGYNTADSTAYLLPAHLIFAIWIGLGAARLFGLVANTNRVLAAAGSAAALALTTLPALAAAPAIDASQDRRAIEFAESVLAEAPAGAIVVTASDRDTFPLWYYHYALGERPDLAVIAEPLLEFGWYRENLRSTYPALAMPAQPGTSWLAALLAANHGRPQVCHTNPAQPPPLVCDGGPRAKPM